MYDSDASIIALVALLETRSTPASRMILSTVATGSVIWFYSYKVFKFYASAICVMHSTVTLYRWVVEVYKCCGELMAKQSVDGVETVMASAHACILFQAIL